MSASRADSDETRRLLERIDRGDSEALGALLARHRTDLRAFVKLHLDPRLAARVDPSDLVQEVQAAVAGRMADYLRRRPMPFHLWARKAAYDRLLNARRDHLRKRRTVAREVAWPDRSSLLLARPLLPGPSPSQQAVARERADLVGRAVATLSDADREVLLMRHTENLPYDEIACLLEIEPAAARKRYGRALIRLQKALAGFGVLE
jgi:RNA polymerase sigma-70 factor (ECF subfamily)